MLVRVRAAALNAIDSALAARTMAQMIPHRYPLVLAVTPPGPSRRQGRVISVTPGDATIGHMLPSQPVRPDTLGEYAWLPTAAPT